MSGGASPFESIKLCDVRNDKLFFLVVGRQQYTVNPFGVTIVW